MSNTMNITTFVDKINKSKKDIPKFLTECLSDAADKLVADTKSRTPVDTGNLQKSWVRTQVEQTGNEYKVKITNDAQNPDYGTEYASYVEYGHNSRAGNWVEGAHMLARSQEDAKDFLEKKLRTEADKVFSTIE